MVVGLTETYDFDSSGQFEYDQQCKVGESRKGNIRKMSNEKHTYFTLHISSNKISEQFR